MKLEDLQYSLPNQLVDEKNFDVEKWRKENPVDYFKYLYILEQQQEIAKDATFQAIYKVIRMYIPDVLYKYYSFTDNRKLNEIKIETLRKNRLYLSDIQSFNDPFDAKSFYYNPAQLRKYRALDPFEGRLIDDFAEFIRATSLTANGIQSMPMWAHYANNHTGFCVAYNMKENKMLSSCTFPVQYTDERLDITSMMERLSRSLIKELRKMINPGNKRIEFQDLSIVYAALLLCNIKHSSWAYEKEFRCTMGATASGMPYVEAKPNAIYAGMKCSQESISRLIQIAKSLNIPIYQMEFDELSPAYKLLIKEIHI